ncbi:MAG TPA: leucyl aminopeptidase [Actinomycetota bacterium]
MVKVAVANSDALRSDADLLVVPVFAGRDLGPGAAEALAALGTPHELLLEARGFEGKAGQAMILPTFGRLPAAELLLVGLGERDQVDAEALRRAAAVAVRSAGRARRAVTTLAQALPDDPQGAVQAVSEGAHLGAYRFDKYKAATREESARANGRLAELTVSMPAGAGLDQAAARGEIRARATNLARDLSNEPASSLHPEDLAEAARQLADKGVAVTVKDEGALAAEGFGGIVGVGQGAANPPRLVELRYEPEGSVGRVVLVGKGITFDSGGLSLKPPEGMETMKTDMSGAAAVVGVMSALADLGVRVTVTGYLAAAENMPSGSATRPGDVLTMRNGKTVEVLNTDAEGRLVMADALAYGAEGQPDAMVDVATLTGAAIVALGLKYTGLMSNDDALAAELLDAAAAAGEPTWRLPLPQEYHKQVESEVADLKNVGSRWGGALNAGLFLEEFVAERPWAHLDIAGPARAEETDGTTPKGSTGVAVRTLLTWLERRGQGA